MDICEGEFHLHCSLNEALFLLIAFAGQGGKLSIYSHKFNSLLFTTTIPALLVSSVLTELNNTNLPIPISPQVAALLYPHWEVGGD